MRDSPARILRLLQTGRRHRTPFECHPHHQQHRITCTIETSVGSPYSPPGFTGPVPSAPPHQRGRVTSSTHHLPHASPARSIRISDSHHLSGRGTSCAARGIPRERPHDDALGPHSAALSASDAGWRRRRRRGGLWHTRYRQGHGRRASPVLGTSGSPPRCIGLAGARAFTSSAARPWAAVGAGFLALGPWMLGASQGSSRIRARKR